MKTEGEDEYKVKKMQEVGNLQIVGWLDYTWNFFISILFISIKAQIFSIYLLIYHLFKHFAQAQPKSAMLIKKIQVYI